MGTRLGYEGGVWINSQELLKKKDTGSNSEMAKLIPVFQQFTFQR